MESVSELSLQGKYEVMTLIAQNIGVRAVIGDGFSFSKFNVIYSELLRTALGEMTQNDAIRPIRNSRSFKVTTFSTTPKPIRHFLCVNYGNLLSISHRFQHIAEYV